MGPSQSGRITAEPSSGVVNSIGSDPALALPIRNEPFVAGELIAEKYKVERVIGVGGVAIVVAARHIDLDELVAIKVLQPEVQTKRDLVARFAREAKAAVKIKSEYAARILDVGVSPGRGPYLIMEYLEGQDLGAQLVASGPLPYKRAVEYVMQACEALAVAHANGIVHRDIKPENLFLAKRADGSEAVKVLDFGISKAALTGTLFGVGENMVQTQELMGTPLYMSPEQIRSTASVDRRSDIWSLGVVLYELITGHLAFSGEAITKICADVLEKEPAPLSKYIVDLPDGLQQVVTRCLAKDPDKRFQNVGELALALLPFGPSKGRILAERSSAIMNSGGPNDPVVMKFSSSPPPTSASVRSSASPGTIPSSGRVPNMPASGSHVPTGAAGAPPPAPAVAAPGAPKQALVVGRKQGKTILSLAGVAVFLLMGLAAVGTFILVGSSKATSPVASASTVPAAPSLRPLTITTEPPGARVEWEGKLLGETPVTTTFPIGVNTLKLTHDGYTPETISVTVAAADAPDRKASLTMTKIGDKPPIGGPALTVTGGGPVSRPSFLPSRQPGMGSGRGFAANGSKSAAAPAAPPPAAPPVSPIDTSSTGTTSAAAKTVQPPAAPPPKVKLIGEKKTNVVVVE